MYLAVRAQFSVCFPNRFSPPDAVFQYRGYGPDGSGVDPTIRPECGSTFISFVWLKPSATSQGSVAIIAYYNGADVVEVLNFDGVQLNEVDTSSIEPMIQVESMHEGHPAPSCGENLRWDVVQPSLDRSVVMHQAPETDGHFFKVPKVIDR